MTGKHLLIAALLTTALTGPVLAERGSDGTLNVLYWQAPIMLNPYLSHSSKDADPASLVVEPLANYDHEGRIVPTLAEEIPTLENGGVAADLRSITWKLKPGVLWSDGTPLTAADVVFSAKYCLEPATGCGSLNNFADVSDVVAVDDLTVRIEFATPKPFPYQPFVTAYSPVLQQAQFKDCMGAGAAQCTAQNFGPVGTGPYKVDEFRSADVIKFSINEKFRDASQPAFSNVVIKGGGDALTAARAVLETGEFDYAWNIQVEPEVLAQLTASGRGVAVTAFGPTVENIHVQLTNPDPALGEKRATVEGGPHPFLGDINVRKALSMAIDRSVISEIGYGEAGQPTCNILAAPPSYVSGANDACLKADVDGANALLDQAGWVRGANGIREKDGVPLKVLYQTSTNSVRQGTQALVKQMWQAIGVDAELRNIDPGVFFGQDQASPDTYQKFYSDVQMYAGGFTGGDPEGFLRYWGCDEVPSPGNKWSGSNVTRFCSPEYDALLDKLAETAASADREAIAKQLNDIVVQNYSSIPLVHRGLVSARSATIENMHANDWDSPLAFVREWTRKK